MSSYEGLLTTQANFSRDGTWPAASQLHPFSTFLTQIRLLNGSLVSTAVLHSARIID